MLRSAIALARTNGQIRSLNLYFKCTPLPIAFRVYRPVRNRVLLAKLIRNSSESIAQRWSTWRLDKFSTSLLRKSFQRGSALTSTCSAHVEARHVDRVDARSHRKRTLN